MIEEWAEWASEGVRERGVREAKKGTKKAEHQVPP